jgi:hypothetical protein
MGTLRTWSFHLHIAVLVLHHLTKSSTRGWHPERFADSAQILAASNCHFFMDREEPPSPDCKANWGGGQGESPTTSRITLHGRGRQPAPYARLEILSDGILDYRIAEAHQSWTEPKRMTAENRIVNLLEEGWSLTSDEIAKRIGKDPSTVRHALKALSESGTIEPTKTRKERTRYCLKS